MEVILLGIYGFFVWLIFYKFKWLPMNFTAAVITITLPIVAMMAMFLLLNIAAPATDDVRAMNYVIPVVPRITGQVTEVPIQPNRPIKKGDVLFKIDPVPFEAAVKAAEATLRGANDQLNNAANKKAALTPRTKHLFGREMLARMRPSAWLINVARGGLIDADALVNALREERIGGAALDVTEPEPLPADHPLWSLEDAIITPHVANTLDMSLPELHALVRRNIRHFARGESLEGLVDPALGY